MITAEFTDATTEEIDQVITGAWNAFQVYRKFSLRERAALMKAIAAELENYEEVLDTAARETNLPLARLRAERGRTVFQLNSYADACVEGTWMDIRIDTANPARNPPRPDLRKMLVPLGPVVVFGSSNFPFAYSTAGGDTACALAAGCPVIVKAHPGHPQTSEMVAERIRKVLIERGLPEGIFSHVHGREHEVGKALVEHPLVSAVGFTGSFSGGRQIWEWANQRKVPIPVFAEMGSVNPVFLLPEKLKESAETIAEMLTASFTLGAGQFCTNPGLIIGLESDALKAFIHHASSAIEKMQPSAMLHAGIFKGYVEKRANALAQEGVEMAAVSATEPQFNEGSPTLATVSGEIFLNNPVLHLEVFGPYSLVVRCKDATEMLEITKHLEGQLTASVMATGNDLGYHEELVEAIRGICGRYILNGVPTGVEVSLGMQHGGPYPATTDSRFTSVGADGIKRFARPLCFQNWSDEFLPEELRNANPLGIWRTVNNKLTKDPVA